MSLRNGQEYVVIYFETEEATCVSDDRCVERVYISGMYTEDLHNVSGGNLPSTVPSM